MPSRASRLASGSITSPGTHTPCTNTASPMDVMSLRLPLNGAGNEQPGADHKRRHPEHRVGRSIIRRERERGVESRRRHHDSEEREEQATAGRFANPACRSEARDLGKVNAVPPYCGRAKDRRENK